MGLSSKQEPHSCILLITCISYLEYICRYHVMRASDCVYKVCVIGSSGIPHADDTSV